MLNPCDEAEIFHKNKVNTVAAVTLIPSIIKSSTFMLLVLEYTWNFSTNE